MPRPADRTARPPAPSALAACVLLGGSLWGCNNDDIQWVRFNGAGESLTVEVFPLGTAPGDPVVRELTSDVGQAVVGTAAIDPGVAPVGTSHLVQINVAEAFEEIVGRATVVVETDAVDVTDDTPFGPNQGEGEYEMRRDSSDIGLYTLSVQSLGRDDTRRTDSFTLRLWQPEQLAPDLDPATE